LRSTKASAAIERLKRRSGEANYSLVLTSHGHFCLALMKGNGESERLCAPMELDEFVSFVNGYGPQVVKKESKLDIAFSKQLKKSSS
jgi:hypothetical protein